MKSSIILSLAIASVATAAKTCNKDNVYRCLLASSSIAEPFCQSYISVPVITTTISTTTPVVTVTKAPGGKMAREAKAEPTLKIMDMNARRQAALKTALAKLQPPTVTLRAELLHRAAVIAPGCLTQVSSTSYPASRISSACSCIVSTTSTVSYVATAAPTTITVTAGPSTTLISSRSVSTTIPGDVPAGPFKISSPSSIGSFLAGILLDDFYTGFKLPYGEYDLQFTIDQATGYVKSTAPGKAGSLYLVAYTGLLKADNTIPYVVTESSPIGAFWRPFTCRVGKDANGKYPLMCRAGDYTVPTLVSVNGDGNKQLGIAKPGDKSGSGPVGLFAEFL